jgi:manganese/zinc/iron transport system substrate-binding protein
MSFDGAEEPAASGRCPRARPRDDRPVSRPARRLTSSRGPSLRPASFRLSSRGLPAFGLSLALALSLSHCGPPDAPGDKAARGLPISSRPIRVVTTTGMIADIARNVGRDRVTVVALMGPGIDPHQYRAREGDIRRLARADLILYNGLHLEARLGDVLQRLGQRKRTVAVSQGIDEGRLLGAPGSPQLHDPHIWFDVTLWIEAARTVGSALVEIDPAHADVYRGNTDAYVGELERLDAYVREQAARVPAEKRVLITAHDAFHYFGRAYGFEVRGLQGISTASEAGTGDLQRLAAFVAERRIPALFVESSVSPRNLRAVQAAVRARGFEVGLGGSLFSDAMGSPGTPEGTYAGMVRHNIDTIVSALLREPGRAIEKGE